MDCAGIQVRVVLCERGAVCMGEEEGDFERAEGEAFARILLWAAD